MVDQLIIEEIRNTCKCPQKYQFLDYGGVLFGIFFIIDSINRARKGVDGWAAVELGIGTIMALIHSTRFFYKKELR